MNWNPLNWHPWNWGITFAQPWWLLALLVLPLLAFLKGRRGGSPSVVFSSTTALRNLGRHIESKAGRFSAALVFFALVLLIVALARPQRGKSRSHIEASGVDI